MFDYEKQQRDCWQQLSSLLDGLPFPSGISKFGENLYPKVTVDEKTIEKLCLLA